MRARKSWIRYFDEHNRNCLDLLSLLEHYGYDLNIRETIVSVVQDWYFEAGTILISVNGSPPKAQVLIKLGHPIKPEDLKKAKEGYDVLSRGVFYVKDKDGVLKKVWHNGIGDFCFNLRDLFTLPNVQVYLVPNAAYNLAEAIRYDQG